METEKTSYGAFERFLYLFFIPALFTVILTVVLLSLFNYDVSNTLLKTANSIPVISSIVPDPKSDGEEAVEETEVGTPKAEDMEMLKSRIQELEAELALKGTSESDKDKQILDLQARIEELTLQLDTKKADDDAYQAQIQEVASMYARMAPNKAAPILENLTRNERLLVLQAMKPSERVAVLEKMNPTIAAESSILLKDSTPSDNPELLALQERLDLYEDDNKQESGNALSNEELGQTFAAMTAANAASVLLEMNKTNSAQVTNILREMNVQARSSILTELSNLSEEEAAKISARLSAK